MDRQRFVVLLVEDNADFARLVEHTLSHSQVAEFSVHWVTNGGDAVRVAETQKDIDLILMDYFLPGDNGLEVTRLLRERGVQIPIVFLTTNKNLTVAVEVMKLGVEDYLVKEEVLTPILGEAIVGVIEQTQWRKRLAELEMSKRRLEAIQELTVTLSHEINNPLTTLKLTVDALLKSHPNDDSTKYLTIMRESILRIEEKVQKLRALRDDKTIPYVQDIRMIDLS